MIAVRFALAVIVGLGVAMLATLIASIATGAVSMRIVASLEAAPLLIGVVAGAAGAAVWAAERHGRQPEQQRQAGPGAGGADDDSVESILEKYKL